MVRNSICCVPRFWQAEAHGTCLSSFCLTVFSCILELYLHDNAAVLRFHVGLYSASVSWFACSHGLSLHLFTLLISSTFRVDKIATEGASTKETNNIPNHRVLIKPEVQNNQKNKEISKMEEKRALEAEKYGFQKDGQERPLTKINSVKLNSLPSEYETGLACPPQNVHYRPINVNSSDGRTVNVSLADVQGGSHPNAGTLATEADRVIQRTNSMQQLEQWIKIQKGRGLEEDPRG